MMKRVILVASSVTVMLGANALLAQATRPAPPAPPAASPTPVRPPGSTIKCNDESWAPAGSLASACDVHGGVKYRFVEKLTPPPSKTRPDSAQTRMPPPSKGVVAIPEGGTPIQPNASATPGVREASARQAPAAPPAGATLLCVDGTYLTGTAEPARCTAHGGLVAKLPPQRP